MYQIFFFSAEPTRWQSWTEGASTNYSVTILATLSVLGSRFEAWCAVLMAGGALQATPRHFQMGPSILKLAA